MYLARSHVRGRPGVDVVNGQSWKAGYTGTMIKHGARHRSTTDPSRFHPGRTMLFYGGPSNGSSPKHVAIFVGDVHLTAGTRWNGAILRHDLDVTDAVCSHGRTAGPEFWPFNYRPVVQARAYAV